MRKPRPRTPADKRLLRELGAKLRAARKRAGLTQEAVSAAIVCDITYVQRLEGGTVNAELLTLVRYARALDRTVWQLLAAEAVPVKLTPRRGRPKRTAVKS